MEKYHEYCFSFHSSEAARVREEDKSILVDVLLQISGKIQRTQQKDLNTNDSNYWWVKNLKI